MEQKPAGIIYGVNEIPPLRTTLLLGLTAGGQIDQSSAIVAAVTLLLIIALSVWPQGHIRLYSVLIGLVFQHCRVTLCGCFNQRHHVESAVSYSPHSS